MPEINFTSLKSQECHEKLTFYWPTELHIFLLNQAVLIRNFSRLIFPIWSLVDLRCETIFQVGSFEIKFSRFHFLSQVQQLGLKLV